MAIKGRQIPEIQGVADQKVADILSAMKDAIERLSGSGNAPGKKPIKKLGAGATLAGVVNKVNELLDQMQAGA
jgi:hypothetical protein